MKRIILILSVFVLFISAKTQPPTHYYDATTGLTGAPLKTALYNIIRNHTVRSYPLWSWYDETDLQPAPAVNKIWDIYTDNCNFTFSSDQCGNVGTTTCICYNNEHSFPKSWFGDVSPMNSDIFHIYPTDGKVNGVRSNFPYGETSTGTTWGNGKIGFCTYPGYTGTVFEPADQYKGDLARTYFYMATRYENVIASWEHDDANGDAILNGTSFPSFETWFLNLLLKWNTQDPVSTKEINRNNAIFNTVQFNRNPFIDHPEWVAAIWGNGSAINDTYSNIFNNISIYPNPSNEMITINNLNNNIVSLSIADIVGKIFYTSNNPSQSLELNISNYAKGFYFLTVYADNNQSKTFKFIKD